MARLKAEDRAFDDEFLEEVDKQSKDIVVWWKRKYNYSSNDERYKTATMLNVYEDWIEDKIIEFREEVGDNPFALQILKGRKNDSEFDKKQSNNFREKIKKAFENINGKEKSNS